MVIGSSLLFIIKEIEREREREGERERQREKETERERDSCIHWQLLWNMTLLRPIKVQELLIMLG